MNLHSYPSIYALGHRAVADLLKGEVIVEEKVDGSQITFGVIDGNLCIRSKGAEIFVEAPEKMFALAVEKIVAAKDKMIAGWHYRGEYLQKPKHNALAYERVPLNHIVIFDIDRDGIGDFADRATKTEHASLLGFDVIPELFRGVVSSLDQFTEILNADSYLGGQKIEGVVVKPVGYDLYGADKKVLMGKYVREDFRELNDGEWKKSNPGKGDMIALIGHTFHSEARWRKAIQHLRDSGLLENSPRDIGLVIKEVPEDIKKEHADEIKEKLFAWAWPQIRRIACAGIPEWYKQQLLNQQFGPESTPETSEGEPQR